AGMTTDALADGLPGAGVPADDARAIASRVDERMKACILSLYRSAVTVGEEWEDGVAAIRRPGLILWSRNDPYVAARFAERPAAHRHSRAPGRRRARGERPDPRRASQRRLRVSDEAGHGEPRTRRCPQGGRGIRPADRPRNPRGRRQDSAPCARRLVRARRA